MLIIIISGVIKLNAKISKIYFIINIINYIFIRVFIGISFKFIKIIKLIDYLLTGKYFKLTSKWILLIILFITVIEFIYRY
jgi:hypothetical protein